MKYSDLSSKNRSLCHWINFAAASLLAVALAGCGGGGGGGGGGGSTTTSSPSTPTSPTGATAPLALSSNASTATLWQALQPNIDPASVSVSINSPPVVKFTVTDANGAPVVGLGGQSQSATGVTHSNYDISFTLAKLVPGTNGEPSKWVNYLVTKPVAAGTAGAVAADGLSWVGTYPSAETQGTLVDNGDGTYQYTFLRDIRHAKDIVAGLTDSGSNAKADLGDLTYDPTLTHRLGIFISGSMPGTGTATATAVQSTTPVPLVRTFNIGYDFVPAGGPVTVTRDIVQASSCNGCHDNVSHKRGIGHISLSSATNGIPAGAYVGRNDPRLCVTCHTDQVKYGFAQVTPSTNADGSPAYTGAYYRTNPTVNGLDQAAFIYPRMIHQTHMGNQLIRTGYNLNNHCKATLPSSLANNSAQCFNLVGFPQDQRDCTKCHDGSATKSDGSVNANQTKDGDNWKNVPSQVACGACHDGINFATAAGIRLADRDADLAAGNPVGTTATGHGAISPVTDSDCHNCHTAAAIPVYHASTQANLNSVGVKSGVDTLAYNIKSVSVNSSKQPVITFQIKVNGTVVTQLNQIPLVTNGNTGALVADQTVPPMPQFPELLDPVSSANRDGTVVNSTSATMNGLALYAVFAVPQDGIPKPADFNARSSVSLTNILIAAGSPKAGSLSNTVTSGVYQADASGYFTATLTGDTIGQAAGAGCAAPVAPAKATCVVTKVSASPIVIPATAVMVTGAMIGGFTQTNVPGYRYTKAHVTDNPVLPKNGGTVGGAGNCTAGTGIAANSMTAAQCLSDAGGLHVTAPLQQLVATTYQPRRVINSAALCNNCHDQLGTNPDFHSGDRNDPAACNFCHYGNETDADGWSGDSSTWLHGIHGASKRTAPFTPVNTDYSTVLYPGLLKDCNQCHLPNTNNFGATGGAALQPNLLWSYVATGTVAAPVAAAYAVSNPQLALTTNTTLTISPYVTVGTVYGNNFSYSVATGVSTAAAATTLVNSPIASVCFACHDTSSAKGHMTTNGGVIYGLRGAAAALVNNEACLVCHGQGTIEDAAVVHQQP